MNDSNLSEIIPFIYLLKLLYYYNYSSKSESLKSSSFYSSMSFSIIGFSACIFPKAVKR